MSDPHESIYENRTEPSYDQLTDTIIVGDYDAGCNPPDDADYIINVSGQSTDTADETYDLVDGHNDLDVFADATAAVMEAVAHGDTTLVHCAVGMSRSPAVAIAAFGALEHEDPAADADLDTILERFKDERPLIDLHPAFEASIESFWSQVSRRRNEKE